MAPLRVELGRGERLAADDKYSDHIQIWTRHIFYGFLTSGQIESNFGML